MSRVLMSIKPEYVDKIFSGVKKYEYRKKIFKKDIDKIVVYATAPVKKVVGELEIDYIIRDNKEKVWNMTFEYGGIVKDKYDAYYQNQEMAIAYKISKVVKYNNYKNLEDFGVNSAPQSYIYLD